MPSGIAGFDEITRGGLPRRRITAVLGGAGSGKTIFGLQTLVAGAKSSEPGIFVAFEESAEQVIANASRFNWGLASLQGNGVEFLDAQLPQAVVHGGEFDLIGLLSILESRAKKLRAKRVVFDGIDVLLSNLGDPALVRREVFRLREWIQQSGMTAIITAKADDRGAYASRDYDFLQFMADCVVSLHHVLDEGIALRALRVAKYRGDEQSANEFPFTITNAGIEVAGGTSIELNYAASTERISSGVERLDAMLGGGYYRGSSVLMSGAPGTAKTSLAAAFAESACRRKEQTIYVSLDEAPDQIVRNVASIGIQFAPHVKTGMLRMCSLRTRSASPESHVARIRALVQECGARNLVVDPISALSQGATENLADHAALQLFDLAKSKGITVVASSLLANAAQLSEKAAIGISTIADTWMHVSYMSQGGERNRALTIIKSRGASHSNQVREMILSSAGITLADVYSASGEVLMGTLRWEKENEERRTKGIAERDAALRQKQAELALVEVTARVSALQGELALREAELKRIRDEREVAVERQVVVGTEHAKRRGADKPHRGRSPRAKEAP